jgi:hypothetical protein
MGDFVAGVLNFEGKFWRTVPMLAWCPGDLTRRYIAGERARFISPIALYLFTVFLMFAVFNFTGGIGQMPTRTKQDIEKQIASDQFKLKILENQKASLVQRQMSSAKLDEKITDLQGGLKGLRALQNGDFRKSTVQSSGDIPDWLKGTIGAAVKDPRATSYKVQEAASKFSWLLIPLSVPFLWLLFPFSRKYRLYDHTVFVTYSLSFMMMLVVVGGILVQLGSSAVAGFLLFVPPFHMYRQLRGAYRLGRISAFLRTVALMIFAFIAAGLFLAAAFAIGMVGS